MLFRSGETLGIVGESGCGKSTTARLIARLLTPDQGKLVFDGEGVAEFGGLSLPDYRRSLQMVFQDSFASLNPRMTVEDTISFGPRVHGLSAVDALDGVAVGDTDGIPLGIAVGDADGDDDGTAVGVIDGVAVGDTDGLLEGILVVDTDGVTLCFIVGMIDGVAVCDGDGDDDGAVVRIRVGRLCGDELGSFVGNDDLSTVGTMVGRMVGIKVGLFVVVLVLALVGINVGYIVGLRVGESVGNVQLVTLIINCISNLTSIDPNPETGSHPLVAANP